MYVVPKAVCQRTTDDPTHKHVPATVADSNSAVMLEKCLTRVIFPKVVRKPDLKIRIGFDTLNSVYSFDYSHAFISHVQRVASRKAASTNSISSRRAPGVYITITPHSPSV